MSHEDSDFDDDDWFEEEADPQLPSFTVGLAIAGDEGSSFRLQNDRSAPYQRQTYIERKSAIDIRCSAVDVVHGLWSPKGEAFATLIVLDFRFDARKRAARIESADIDLRFAAMRSGDSDPEVFAISHDGTLNLVPTTKTVTSSNNANLTIGGGAGVTASGGLGWDHAVTQERGDHTTVTGSIDLKGRNYGSKNACSWTMIGNKSAKTGVPNYMRAAILLRRKDEKQFQCVVKIKAEADFKTSVSKLFGRKEKDDPVLFDPNLEPTSKLQKYDTENLGSFDVGSVADLTFATILQGAIKEKTLST